MVEVMKAIGFPFDRGRLDESEHPFTEGVPGDIRVTTRFDPDDLFSGLLGAMHETGHAMYDLGLPQDWRDQPVGRDRGMALEESQSLLMEMFICRSRPFVRYVQPLLMKHFGVSGPEWELENVYAHLTRVQRGLIRVDADELTYPLHIMLRYELEKELLSGELAVRDLPEAWNAGMEQRLGIRPANAAKAACRTSIGRSARSATFPPMPWAPSSPPAVREPAQPSCRARRAARARGVRRPVRLAARAGTRTGREDAGAGAAEGRNRQAAFRRRLHPLRRGEVPGSGAQRGRRLDSELPERRVREPEVPSVDRSPRVLCCACRRGCAARSARQSKTFA